MTQPPLSSEVRWFIGLVAVLVLLAIGMVVLGFLFRAWRRYNQQTTTPRKPSPMPDLWQAGGDRLVSRLNQSQPWLDNPRQSPPQPDEDDDDDEEGDEEIDDR